MHESLVIRLVLVEGGEPRVDHVLDLRDWMSVHDGLGVQRPIINAESEAAVGLPHTHNWERIGQLRFYNPTSVHQIQKVIFDF